MGARETLAAIRAAREKEAPVVAAASPAPVVAAPNSPRAKLAEIRAARVPTNALDAAGLTGAEVKRRAAAGEPIVQEGPRAGTRGEQMGALGIEAVTGVAEGLGGMVGLAADAATDIMTAGPVRRGARATLKAIRGEKVDPADLTPPMRVTATATAAADDLRRTARDVTGLEGVEIGPVGDVTRGLANVLTPGPELVGAARQLRGAATLADDATPPVLPSVLDDAAGATVRSETAIPERDLKTVWTEYQTARREADEAQQFITDAEERLGRVVSPDEATDPHFMMRIRTEIGGEPEIMSPRSQVRTWKEAYAKWEEVARRTDLLERELDEVAAREGGVSPDDVRGQAFGGGNRVVPDNVKPIRPGADASTEPAGVRAPEMTEPDFVADELARKRTPPPSEPPTAGDGGGPFGDRPIPKYSRPSAINLERQNVADDVKRWEAETNLQDGIRQELEAIKGAPLTNAEVTAAAERGRLLTDVTTRDATVDLAADMLASRNELARMAKEGRATVAYLDLQAAISSKATQLGRLMNTLKIPALADEAGAAAMREVTQQLEQIGKTSDEIAEALKGVDFNDPAQAAEAFRTNIKPKFGDLLDAYRYTNLLSSPKTHIVNLTSNLIQAGITRPLDLMASGAVDWFGSKLTGTARTRYVTDVKPYYRGMFASYPKAVKAFTDVMTGKSPIEHLDMARAQAQNALPTALKIVPRLLDGIDKFVVKLIEGGEYERIADIAKKGGQQFNEVEAAKTAMANAKEYAFRKPLDTANESGHGAMLSTIDEFTSRVSHVLNTKVGGTQPLRWVVPFIQTPMNIFKAGIEHSPLGFGTLYKSTRKTEQLGKAITGSAVFMGAGMLAMDDRTTWAPPRNPKDRAAFYKAGMQPYAVKIGDAWISYSKLGPLAYPIAMAAAMKYQAEDNPKATGNMDAALLGRIMGSLAEFFSDQSYMQGIGDILNAAEGGDGGQAEGAATKTISNFASQLVPLSGLQRWVAQIVDPVYRKGSKELSAEGIIQNLQRNIPGASRSVPPQLTPSGEESLRQLPMVNAVTPFGVSVEDPGGAAAWKDWMNMRKQVAAAKRAAEQ